jgi:glucose-6-phosphate 1-dehydrogenase
MSDSASPPIPEPCTFVIFGASGDLTHRLLVPALYNLEARKLLPEGFAIVGVSRGEMSADAFRAGLAKGLRQFATATVDDGLAGRLLSSARYVAGEASDPTAYERLASELSHIEASSRRTREPHFLSGDSTCGVCTDRLPSRAIGSRAREWRVAQNRHREAVRYRSRQCAGTQ